MLGFNFPGFGILDIIAIQCEWFSSPYINSHITIGGLRGAIPHSPQWSNDDPIDYLSIVKKDNFYWSVLVQKEMVRGISISLQFARDHYRSFHNEWSYGTQSQPIENFFRNKDWYWMTQISWSI